MANGVKAIMAIMAIMMLAGCGGGGGSEVAAAQPTPEPPREPAKEPAREPAAQPTPTPQPDFVISRELSGSYFGNWDRVHMRNELTNPIRGEYRERSYESPTGNQTIKETGTVVDYYYDIQVSIDFGTNAAYQILSAQLYNVHSFDRQNFIRVPDGTSVLENFVVERLDSDLNRGRPDSIRCGYSYETPQYILRDSGFWLDLIQ